MGYSYYTQGAIILLLTTIAPVASVEDWLVNKMTTPVTFTKTPRGTWRLDNGLIYREFITQPNFMTVDFYSVEREQSLLRAVDPEAQITLDGKLFNVGNVLTDIPRAYLNRTALFMDLRADMDSFQFHGYKTMDPIAQVPYTPKRGVPKNITWPLKGLRLDVEFRAPKSAPKTLKSVAVFVHYEMYIGMPILVKWVSVIPLSSDAQSVDISPTSVEHLSVNQQWTSNYDGQNNFDSKGWLYIETDQSHGTSVTWSVDTMASKMPGSYEPVVTCAYDPVPKHIKLGSEGFESFRVHELVLGTSDVERSALARHRMLRSLAPWTQENPIFFHMTKAESSAMRGVIDQLADVGFEMMIYSFGSGFSLESTDVNYINSLTADIAYAKSKGIEVGGYDLIVLTRGVQESWMAVDNHNKSIGSACIASGWYDELLHKMISFMDRTGLSMVETDGPYGGQPCASTNHSHHVDEYDSIYWQQKLQGRMYSILRQKGVYVNQPDYYFYQGGSRTGLGYNENQYSLPRWQDLSISRQSVYDDTYRLTPTAGWMFVPLVVYHSGGSAAEFEPLTQHVVEYEWALATYLGAGVAACYRGFRLYDSNITRPIVKKWVDFYKKYRDIVTSDIIHVRRPDMQSIDSFMHVNPYIENKALAMVFNPTTESLTQALSFPLYYTGLTNQATVYKEGISPKQYSLDRQYNIHVNVTLGALEITWFLIK